MDYEQIANCSSGSFDDPEYTFDLISDIRPATYNVIARTRMGYVRHPHMEWWSHTFRPVSSWSRELHDKFAGIGMLILCKQLLVDADRFWCDRNVRPQ